MSEPREKVIPQPCAWTVDRDEVWQSACGGEFTLNDGTPTDNSMRFCCHCGAPLITADRPDD